METILPWLGLTVGTDPAPEKSTQMQKSIVSLRHYADPNVSPPTARVQRSLKRLERPTLGLWFLWKSGYLAASKATEVSAALISHTIWGPRKKSWGYEMTLVSALMRGAGRHSALFDIPTMRLLVGLSGIVPLPADALATPVTFKVRQRKLRGILAELDAAESGSRELSGEWVVGKKTWQRLQAEWLASRRQESRGDGSKSAVKRKERVVYYLHGGAYYFSSAASQRIITIPLSKSTDTRVFALDYRLAPETQFPGPLHDAVSGYLRLIEDLHIPAENIIVSGDSAGGGLTLALLMYLRDNDYPLPACSILLSPWVDLTMSCDSWETNSAFDIVPVPDADNHMNPVALYLGDNVEKYLTHPYASPLFGDFKDLPPMLIQAGEAEVLRDEITLLAHKASLAGVEVRHEVYDDAVHVFHTFPFLEASTRAFMSCRDFVCNVLPRIQSNSPRLLDQNTEAQLEGEIDNEKATVVRGDGVETGTGMRAVVEELDTEDEGRNVTESEAEMLALKAFPSWGPAPAALSSETDADESDDSDDSDVGSNYGDNDDLPAAAPSSLSHLPDALPHHISSLPYVRSALSLFAHEASSLAHSPARRHHSHPGLSSLVDQRNNTPANDTFIFKSRPSPDCKL